MIYFAVVAVLVAATALLIRLFLVDETPGTAQESHQNLPAKLQSRASISRMNTTLPAEWNDQIVTQQLISLGERPPVLTHFVHSLIGRFILGQNDKTAEKRTHLIRTVIGQLEATKDLQIAIDDLEIHSLERAIRFKEKHIEHDGLEDRLTNQKQIADLRNNKDRLELEVEIAKLNQQKRTYEKEQEPTKQKPSREEARQAKKREMKQTENEMAEAILDVTKGVAFDQLSPDEQDRIMRIQNFYNDKRTRLDEELARI
jgi:hypothetical protein